MFNTGVSNICGNIRKDWEPGASTVDDRLTVLKAAHKEGIFTWVSLETVIDPAQALTDEKVYSADTVCRI